jgi:hypothetical protein
MQSTLAAGGAQRVSFSKCNTHLKNATGRRPLLGHEASLANALLEPYCLF